MPLPAVRRYPVRRQRRYAIRFTLYDRSRMRPVPKFTVAARNSRISHSFSPSNDLIQWATRPSNRT